jgi:O-antigen ligase
MRINWQDPRFLSILVVVVIIFLGIFSGRIITGYSYKLILAAILGIAIFITALVNTDAGLAVLIFSMLLSPEIMLGQLPGRDIVIRFDDVLLAIITFTWFAKTAINKGIALFIKTRLNKAIGFYILVCIITTVRGAALGYVTPAKGAFYVLRYAEYFLLYILVVNHIHSRKQIKFFLTALFVTCALVSLYGILQIPSGRRVSAPFEGEVGEPNTFGGYLLFILCIVVGILLQNVPKNLRLTMISLSILIFIPFLFTLSRASYLGIILSFFAFIILSKRKIVLAGIAATIILAGMMLQPEAVFSRVKYTFQKKREARVKVGGVYLDPSASARIHSWKDSFEAWKKQPILGRGITGFKFMDGQYIRTFPEMGVVGFLALAWLLWIIFKQSLGIYKKMDEELYRGLALGFIAGFVGLAVHAMTANTFIIIRIMEPFWFITGIVMMLPSLREEEKNEALKAEQTS